MSLSLDLEESFVQYIRKAGSFNTPPRPIADTLVRLELQDLGISKPVITISKTVRSRTFEIATDHLFLNHIVI